MHPSLPAKYYDGQSSASRLVEVLWDEPNQRLCLQLTEGEVVYWLLSDLSINLYDDIAEINCRTQSNALLKMDRASLPNQLIETIEQFEPSDPHKTLLKLGFVKISAIALGLLGLVVLAYFFLLPVVADKSVSLMPEQFDDQIGNLVMETFMSEYEVDSVKSQYLNAFARELDLGNRKPLTFTVLKADEVNAFALPNGQIVVYEGILEKMRTSDQLVALLGHEASHINQRHSMKMMSRNLAGYLIISILLTDVNGVMTVIADNAQELHSLSYSRKFEQEADEKGLQILMNNRANPRGMVQLFEQLEQEETLTIPALLSSHPLTAERKKHMNTLIKRASFEISPNPRLEQIFRKLKN